MPKLSLPPIPKNEAYSLALATAKQEMIRIANPDLFEQYISCRLGGFDGPTVAHKTVVNWVGAYDYAFNRVLIRDTELENE